MASFRDMKRRIGAVRNIQQITRAMKMVAAARLRRSEEAITALRPYAARLDMLCARLVQEATGGEHPFLQKRAVRGIAVLTVTSDRGLCGAYNNRVVEATLKLLSGNADKDCRVFAVGRKGILRLRQAGYEVHRAYEDVFNPVRFDTAQTIRDELESVFLRGEVDEVLAVFTEYFNPARQVVITRRLLPCPPDTHPEEIRRHYERELPEGLDLEEIETAQVSNVYIHEPDYESVGHRLLEQNLGLLVYRALLEAQASEHGARMVAMDNATENAEDMIAELTLRMNRLRQESITREMLDVVGGAEALRD